MTLTVNTLHWHCILCMLKALLINKLTRCTRTFTSNNANVALKGLSPVRSRSLPGSFFDPFICLFSTARTLTSRYEHGTCCQRQLVFHFHDRWAHVPATKAWTQNISDQSTPERQSTSERRPWELLYAINLRILWFKGSNRVSGERDTTWPPNCLLSFMRPAFAISY